MAFVNFINYINLVLTSTFKILTKFIKYLPFMSLCSLCSFREVETVEHFLFECPTFSSPQIYLKNLFRTKLLAPAPASISFQPCIF